MAVAAVEKAASYDLTTPEAVKSRLRVQGGEYDSLIEALIKEASGEASRYCQRDFVRERVKESNLKYDLGYLILSRTPVVEIHAARRGGEPILDDWEILDAEAGFVALSSGVMHSGESRWWNDPFRAPWHERYEVEYTGGYVTAAIAEPPEARDLPHDLEAAVVEMIAPGLEEAQRRDRPGGEHGAVKSIKVEDITYQYETAAGAFGTKSLSITDRLDRYRRVA